MKPFLSTNLVKEFVFLLLFLAKLNAQAGSLADSIIVANTADPSTVASKSTSAEVLSPEILDVRVLKGDLYSQGKYLPAKPAFANDIIEITISHAKQFFLLRPTDNSKLILYANGIALKGIVSDRFSRLDKQSVLSGQTQLPDTLRVPFQLIRDSTTQDAWKNLFNMAPNWRSNSLSFRADLGWEGMFPLMGSSLNRDLNQTKVEVVFYKMGVYWTWVVLYIALIFLFVYLCANTNLIREGSGSNGAYSLAQTQLVFWTVLIIGGFIYSVVLTDLTTSLNSSVLLMLGVSIGTSGIATSINYYKKQKGTGTTKIHRNFLYDILSDGDTLSVHRTQIMLWNIVFGTYLVIFTISNKTMPVFSETMLVLMGVSSTFYLGSKAAESGGAGSVKADERTAANLYAEDFIPGSLVVASPSLPIVEPPASEAPASGQPEN